jgi:phosphoglycerate dehydrogenase-like enzyme
MKKSSYLINVARGPIVDQGALITALRGGKIAGAGLDVFEREPVEPDCELLRMENVIVAPHALCWTDECFAGIGRAAVRSILDVAEGRAPRNVVNRSVLETQGFKARLARFAAARGR